MTWDEKFMGLAFTVASWSKDPSTKVGAVIVGPKNEVRSLGYNGIPRNVRDDIEERSIRPAKYMWFEHAERNAIYNAARVGTPIEGSTLYCLTTPAFFGPPCADCTRAIIQSGIVRVVCRSGSEDYGKWAERWRESFETSLKMMDESHVCFDTAGFVDNHADH